MQKLSNQERLKPWMGIVLFAVLLALFLTVCTYMQEHWGMTGLVLTEVLFLAVAVGFCLIRKVSIKEVFPIKKVTVREIFGCLFLLLGGQGFSYVTVGLVGMLFPAWASETAELSSFLYSGNALPAFLIVSVTPAICEEAIHRGAILSCFRSIKKDWVIVLIMGLLFGINHMSPLRFMATAILGGILSFVVVKRNNILLSALMHFANNAFSALAGIYSAKTMASSSVAVSFTPDMFGIYLLMGFTAPVFLVLGWLMISPETHKKINFLFAGILSAVMFISGISITVSGQLNKTIVNSTIGYEVTEDSKDALMDFSVEEARTYTVTVVMSCNKDAEYSFVMTDDDGNVLIDTEMSKGSAMRPFTTRLDLSEGLYHTEIRGGEGSVGDKPEIQIHVN
jgi:membrane protease YdiL (CAAX protease family)